MRRNSAETEAISVSEITDYIYCRRAWYYRSTGAENSSPYLRAGIEYHQRHEKRRREAIRYRRIITALVILLLGALVALLLNGLND